MPRTRAHLLADLADVEAALESLRPAHQHPMPGYVRAKRAALEAHADSLRAQIRATPVAPAR